MNQADHDAVLTLMRAGFQSQFDGLNAMPVDQDLQTQLDAANAQVAHLMAIINAIKAALG